MARKLLLVFVAAALVAGTADARPRGDRASAASVVTLPHLHAGVLTEINDLRRSQGLRELQLSKVLSVAALGHSQAMAKGGFFSHAGNNGSPFWARIKPRYRPQPGTTWGVGENLVWASPELSAEDVIKAWMDSPPHRKNLLAPSWREIGLGAVHALAAPGIYQGREVTIVTADFGVR